jgi:hypothetical protein
MKPINQPSNSKTRYESNPRSALADRTFPNTNCDYQTTSPANFGSGRECAPTEKAPSIRDISRDYFRHENTRSFMVEAAFFAMIVLTSAVPLVISAHALVDLVKSMGAL